MFSNHRKKKTPPTKSGLRGEGGGKHGHREGKALGRYRVPYSANSEDPRPFGRFDVHHHNYYVYYMLLYGMHAASRMISVRAYNTCERRRDMRGRTSYTEKGTHNNSPMQADSPSSPGELRAGSINSSSGCNDTSVRQVHQSVWQ
jgi:hypothetical protein